MDTQDNLDSPNVYLALRRSGVYEEDKKLDLDRATGNDLGFNNLVHVNSRERLYEDGSNSTQTLNIPLGIYREIANPLYPTESIENRTSLTYEAPPQPEENTQNIYAEIERKASDLPKRTEPKDGEQPPAVPPAPFRAGSVMSLDASSSSTTSVPIPMKSMKTGRCPPCVRLLIRVIVVVVLMAACFGFGIYVGKVLMKGVYHLHVQYT